MNILVDTLFLMTFLSSAFTHNNNNDIVNTNELLVNRLLPPDYDPIIPPKQNGQPVKVEITVSVLNVRSIKETELSYIVDIFYHQYWSDYRIRHQNHSTDQRIVLDNKWKDKLWIPDSYFKNALNGHVTDIIFPTLYFAIHNQTSIFMASRVSLQLSCDMKFSKFPHDTQECHIDIMSLSHNVDTVILDWKDFFITKNLYLPQFYISGTSHETCTKRYPIGTFSCLRATVRLTRQLGLYIVKKYIPSTLIVVMSFVGFWIPVTAYPARVALVITALLALITQQHQSSEVNVSYVIAINVWMIICITFVFFGLIEYAIAIAFDESRQTRHKMRANNENVQNGQLNDTQMRDNGSDQKGSTKWIHHLKTSGGQLNLTQLFAPHTNYTPVNMVDVVSRYLFPVAFGIFVAFYLLYLYVF